MHGSRLKHRNPPGSDLSLLAQGRGLMGGGVELECFGDDRKAFTLRGEAFLKPSKSPEGKFSKPYRKYELALPTTYVTRKGQMMLFTSPEDMVMGQSVMLHRKEGTIETAVTQLKTVDKLVSSSLTYQPDKGPVPEVGEFTSVYLQRLREAAQRAKETENNRAESLEKGEEGMERGDDLEAADSGMGTSMRPSSGRLSSLSHFSDERISSLSHVSEGTVINIPDGRLTEEGEDDVSMETNEPIDPLKQLTEELSGYTTGTQKSKPKSKSTAGKHPKKKKALSEASLTQKLKPSREGAKTKAKKRKRTKKPVKEDADGSRHTGVGGVVSQGGSKVNDRTIDIERKVIERRALERQRAFEAGERVRLAEELRRLQDEKAKTGSGARFDSVREGEWEGEEGGEEEGEGEGEGAAGVRIRRECDGSNVVKLGRRKEGGERRIGTSFREEMARRKREEETWRKKQQEAERAEKARLAYEKGSKMREKRNYNDHLDLGVLRHTQSISQPYSFSYFRYVPPKTGTSGKGGKGRVGQKVKRKKATEK